MQIAENTETWFQHLLFRKVVSLCRRFAQENVIPILIEVSILAVQNQILRTHFNVDLRHQDI
jgi:hypothetical protein